MILVILLYYIYYYYYYILVLLDATTVIRKYKKTYVNMRSYEKKHSFLNILQWALAAVRQFSKKQAHEPDRRKSCGTQKEGVPQRGIHIY